MRLDLALSLLLCVTWTRPLFSGHGFVKSMPTTTTASEFSEDSTGTSSTILPNTESDVLIFESTTEVLPEEPIRIETTDSSQSQQVPDYLAETTSISNVSSRSDNDLSFVTDEVGTDNSSSSIPITTDLPIIIETTIIIDPELEESEDEFTTLEPQETVAAAQEEIISELHTIWNYTENLNDEESDLKSSLTSLVHFTYDQVVVQDQPGETLGRLKELLRKLRYKLVGQDDFEARSRQRRSTSNAGVDQVENRKIKSLADDIQELENFLSLPPFSFGPNELDYKKDENLYVHDTIDKLSSSFGKKKNKKPPSKFSASPPKETVIQKIIHVQDAFSSSDSSGTTEIPTTTPPSPSTTTPTMMASEFPLISSSGLIQQSSITVKNISGAIIPFNAEQIANSIIKLLYPNHNLTESSQFFSPATASSSSLTNNNNGLLLHGIGEAWPYIPPGDDDAQIQGSTDREQPEPEGHVTNTPYLDENNGIEDIKNIIENLSPSPTPTTTDFPDITTADILSLVEDTTIMQGQNPVASISNGDASNLNLNDIINRIVLTSTSTTVQPVVQNTTTQAELPDFGIAGPGNRQTTTPASRPSSYTGAGLLKTPSLTTDDKIGTNLVSLAGQDDYDESGAADSSGGTGATSIMNSIMGSFNLSSNTNIMSPTALLNGTRVGLVQVIETFNFLNAQAKMALIFALAISVLSIVLGFYSIGPPIIIIGAFGLVIPIVLLIILTRQDKSLVKKSKKPMDDLSLVLDLLADAMNKYKQQ